MSNTLGYALDDAHLADYKSTLKYGSIAQIEMDVINKKLDVIHRNFNERPGDEQIQTDQ